MLGNAACTTSPRARASTTPSARSANNVSACTWGRTIAPVVRSLRRQWPDQSFGQRSEHRGCRERRILERKVSAGERGRDESFEFARDGRAVGRTRNVDVGFDRLGQQRKRQPPPRERARREGRERRRQRGQRARRRTGGLRQRGNLSGRQHLDQSGDQFRFRGEIAVDRAGRDAGPLGDRRNLNGGHAALGGGSLGGRQNRFVTGGQLADHIFSLPVRHGESRPGQKLNYDSN